MTVNTIGSVAEFVTNGVTTNFPFYFKFLANEDLVVTYVNPLGVSSILTLGTHYTANGAGNDQGGSVVTTSALAGPGQLIVSREMEAFQQTSLRNQGKFLAETHEDVFDKLTMLIQQGLSIFARALKRPFGRDYFFAENRRITAVKDPVDDQDAATKLWALRSIAEVIGGAQGPINLASNVYYTGADGLPHNLQQLSGSIGGAIIGHEQSTVGAALNSSLLATNFGVKPGLGIDNYNAIVAFLDLAWAQKKLAIFPAGVYETSKTIEFYRGHNFQTIGIGFPTIKYTGTTPGHVVSIDAGLGSSVYGLLFGGFNIEGNAQAIDGVYKRAVSHSKFYEIRSWDCAQSPFRVVSGVCNEYVGLRLTSAGGRPGAPGIFPQNSLVLQSRVPGDYVAWCTFTNIKAEYAVENGMLLIDATGNTFVGGTAEHCKTGVYLYPACSHNTFINIDYEGNTVNDIGINGTTNKFINNQCLSPLAINISVQGAEGTSFDGGYLRSINLQGASKDTLLTGCSVSDNGALGITGPGTFRAIRVRKVNGSGVRTGMVEEYPTSAFTPGVAGSSASIAVGTYSKHNNIVTGQLYLVLSSVPTAGALRITGLPFAAISTTNSYASVTIGQYIGIPAGPGARTELMGYIAPGSSAITINACGGGLAPVVVEASGLTATAGLMISFSYVVPE